jgi:hypothetical protein
MNRRIAVVLALVVVSVVALLLTQYSLSTTVVQASPAKSVGETTGVVKVLRAAALFSRSKAKRATVTLADGSEVEAKVLPECFVQVGETVRIYIVGDGPSSRLYLVAGPSSTS